MTSYYCKTCGGSDGVHYPSTLDRNGIGHPRHRCDDQGTAMGASEQKKIATNDLHRKLWDILKPIDENNTYNLEHAVWSIVQAFKDAGWYHSPLVDYQMRRIETGELMTGQEWYDRFHKQLSNDLTDNDPEYPLEGLPTLDGVEIEDILTAAKKAAGLTEVHRDDHE